MMAQAQAGITPRTRIVWTDEDRNKVALRAFEHHLENSATDSWVESLQEAQNLMLDPDKARPKSSLYTESQKLKELGSKLYKDKQANTPAMANALTAAQERASTPPLKLVQTTPAPTPPKQVESVLSEQDQKMIDQTVALVGEAYRIKLRARLQTITAEELALAGIQTSERKISLPAVKQKVVLPTILIVGMLPKHATAIKKEYDQFFDLEFVEVDKINNLKFKAAHKDRVIINTAFINGQVWDTVRQHPGLILCAGNGLVTDKLLELACNTK